MRTSSDNPSTNALAPSVKETELIRAISVSGYPLEGLVARQLTADFRIVEEWDFIDDTKNEHRNLDVLASRFYETGSADIPNISLSLLVECKRSIHPFVFFKRVTTPPIPQFPAIAGVS